MSKIKPLSPTLVAQISAGEVILRPVFAIKELVENSLDAGATQIKIILKNSGITQIIVSDNGEGMDYDDLQLSISKNTTSKIDPEDLNMLVTNLGFRGEALSSIVAVSQLNIKTKVVDSQVGYQMSVIDQQVQSINKIGMSNGTTITVDKLFYNTPVRSKFLKSKGLELQKIMEFLINISLSYPAVAFYLSNNDKVIYDLPIEQSLYERIYSIFGAQYQENLIPINFDSEVINISGFISKPQIATKGARKQYLFVNKRSVIDQQISKLIKQIYGGFLMPYYHPVYFINISLPHQMIDVNIHPRKEKINFYDDVYIHKLLKKSIKDTLTKTDLTFQNHNEYASVYALNRGSETSTFNLLKQDVKPWDIHTASRVKDKDRVYQVHNLYLILETERGIMIVDQHAAHERILYEQFKQNFNKRLNTGNSMILTPSIIINLDPVDSKILQQHLEDFQKIGFEIEIFAMDSYKISQIPVIFQGKDIKVLIKEVIDDIANNRQLNFLDNKTDRTIAFLACRSAIKAGDPLTDDEAKELVRKLNNITSGYTCPHGRPVKIELSLTELEKMFKRRI